MCMILIVGGAYQGKLDYALDNYPGYGLSIYNCDERQPEVESSAAIINDLHLAILAQIGQDIDTLAYLQKKLPEWQDKIIICDDISCGVVPLEASTRAWREATGRALTLLSKHADQVIRVFCGIGSRIK